MSAAKKARPYAPKGVLVLTNALYAAANATVERETSMSGTCSLPGQLNGLSSQFVCGYTGKTYRVSLEEVQNA